MNQKMFKWIGSLVLIGMGSFVIFSSQKQVQASSVKTTPLEMFEGTTTFIATSESGVHPELLMEVVDEQGNVTSYESKDGIITISNLGDSYRLTVAKLFGKTKYLDEETNELLDEWVEGRELKLIKVTNPMVKIVGKNLYSGRDFSNENHNWASFPIVLPPGDYIMSNNGVERKTTVFNYDTNQMIGYAINRFTLTETTTVLLAGNENDRESFQLERGTSITSYEPFKTGVLKANESLELAGVNRVKDSLDLMTGNLIQTMGETILDGTTRYEGITIPHILEETIRFDVNIKGIVRDTGTNDTFVHELFDHRLEDREMVVTYADQIMVRLTMDKLEKNDVPSFLNYLKNHPIEVQYQLSAPIMKQTRLVYAGHYQASFQLTGTIDSLMISIDVPTEDLSFVLNPNEPMSQQFITPEFEVTNESNAPLNLTLKAFEQTTDVLNDVLPSEYASWDGLTKEQSKDIALGLVTQPSDDWLNRIEKTHYVSETTNNLLGTIKPKGTVGFEFIAHHGQAFSEMLNPSYRLTLVFDLLN